MYTHQIQLRVRYAETDQMGYVYYGNYASYFEVARVETLRACGITYRELEERGVMLPVRDFQIRYHRPARYDDALDITTTITELPSTRIRFEYQTHLNGELINTAMTDLVFVDRESGRPKRCPEDVLQLLQVHFH